MNKKYGLYILIGIIIGATFGAASLAPAIENKCLATALGGLGGLFIGWFIAAGIHENESSDKETMIERSITKNEIFFFFMIVSIAVLVSSLIIIQP